MRVYLTFIKVYKYLTIVMADSRAHSKAPYLQALLNPAPILF